MVDIRPELVSFEVPLNTNAIEVPNNTNAIEVPINTNAIEVPINTNAIEVPINTNAIEVPRSQGCLKTCANWLGPRASTSVRGLVLFSTQVSTRSRSEYF
ncbi:hypothetical protein TNCV_751411 [Trichonephila clavipes]|uniref:Uncharacterized protein n=1 Tax=Trichonephila clavipes TaxID=2585209 RepID=A0A8X6WA34_TRICX|nr:hypothetical protein TNCV_751411 [Trichonephila clavipes]